MPHDGNSPWVVFEYDRESVVKAFGPVFEPYREAYESMFKGDKKILDEGLVRKEGE